MNLIPTLIWLKKLWTEDNLEFSEWLKEGCSNNYKHGCSWWSN